jgi:hypothetical protein
MLELDQQGMPLRGARDGHFLMAATSGVTVPYQFSTACHFCVTIP